MSKLTKITIDNSELAERPEVMAKLERWAATPFMVEKIDGKTSYEGVCELTADELSEYMAIPGVEISDLPLWVEVPAKRLSEAVPGQIDGVAWGKYNPPTLEVGDLAYLHIAPRLGRNFHPMDAATYTMYVEYWGIDAIRTAAQVIAASEGGASVVSVEKKSGNISSR